MAQGLEVIAGLSDYPYTQMEQSCSQTEFDCFKQIKESYLQILKGGFLQNNSTYHPALRTVVLINEPELVLLPGFVPAVFCKAVVSAFDAVLDAERELGVFGPAPNFTVTVSFGICQRCIDYWDQPSVGTMAVLRTAMMDPKSVGYTPRNDLAKAYRDRFVNSLNTNNPASDFRRLFLNTYEVAFPDVPVFIGEYHNTHVEQSRDLAQILDIAENTSSLLQGITFFEFQKRHDKGGSEALFGMFDLGETALQVLRIKDVDFVVWCLEPVTSWRTGESIPEAVAEAFGGPGVGPWQLCPEKAAGAQAFSPLIGP